MLASREICIMLPVDVAVLDVCNCAFGLVPMSQGGFSGLPLESSRHREILGRSGRWSGVGGVAAAVRASSPIFIPPQCERAPSSENDAITRRRPNTTAPPSPPPPRPRTHQTPRTPLHPVLLVSLRPACILPHSRGQGAHVPSRPRLLPRICEESTHRPSIRRREQPRHSLTECIRDGKHG